MIDYKLNVFHDEDNKLNLSPMRQNRKDYPRKENYLSDDSIMFLPDYSNLCDTINADKTHLSSNKISESIFSVLSSIHIVSAKCRIKLIKTYTATNITIHKITQGIESTTNLEDNDNKGVIHLLINIKCT